MLNIQKEVKSLSHKDERQAANSFVSRHDAFTGAWRGGGKQALIFKSKGFSDLTVRSHTTLRAGACAAACSWIRYLALRKNGSNIYALFLHLI